MKRILSFGGGVNSIALLCLKINNKVDFDEVIMSDTGSEMPETYKYIDETVKPLCKKYNIPFHVIGSKTLYNDYFEKRIIPFRMFRSCTDRYKIRPIKKWAQNKFGKDYITLIGIDAGEKRRVRQIRNIEYPLVTMNIDRKGCKKIIKEFGIPIPVKSGCYFCPFMSIDEWNKLYEKHPNLFKKAEEFEKNCRRYPEVFLGKKRLEELRNAFRTQTKLFEGERDKIQRCVFCE